MRPTAAMPVCLVGVFWLTLGLTAVGRAGDGDRPSFTNSLDLASKYVWRGQRINDEPVAQPSATVAWKGLRLNLWGNYDLTDSGLRGANQFSEVDYTLSYGRPVPNTPLWLEGGVIEYYFPTADPDDTRELYVKLSAAVLLSPSLTVYYDVDEIAGWYAVAAISHSIPLSPLSEKLALGLGSSLGWGSGNYDNGYFGVDRAALNDLQLKAGLTYQAETYLSFAVTGCYCSLLDGDIADGAAADDNIVFVANTTLTF